MKANFKQLSKKTLSCILALAVILCSVTVMFSAFAETEPEAATPYTVSYRSPAIPMFVGKQVLLKDLEIDFSEADGDTYAGDKVIWSAPEGDSAQILGGGFYAAKTGITKFTATYGGKTQNVYVVVNETGNNTFNLVDLDLTKEGEGGFVAEDWIVGGVGVSAVTYAEDGVTKTTLASVNGYGASPLKLNSSGASYSANGINASGGWSRGILLYNSEILKDFADYTYTAGVYFPNYTDNKSATELAATVTLITRANFNTAFTSENYDVVNADQTNATVKIPTANLFTSGVLGVQLSPYGGVGITNLSNDKFDSEANYWPQYQYHNAALENFNYGTAVENYVYRKTAGTDTISVKVDGSDLQVDLNTNNLLDTTAETVHMSDFLITGRNTKPADYLAANDVENIIVAKNDTIGSALSQKISEKAAMDGGSIGIMTTYAGNILLNKVTVSLNIDTMPNLQDPAFYIVKAASPAIPMFENKVVALSDIVLEIGDGLVSADDKGITWAVAEGDNVIIVGDALYAAKVGTTKLTATYGGKTQNVYVIVNKLNDYDFYLVNEDYSDTTTAQLQSDWMYAVSHDGGYWPNRQAASSQKYYKMANGFVSYNAAEKAMKTGYTYSRGGMLLYNAPILSDFADYTLITDVNNYGYEGDQYCYVGIAVRVNANFNAAVAASSLSNDTAVDSLASGSNIFTLANGSLGSGMYLQHRQYGAVLLGNYNNNNVSGDTTNSFGENDGGSEALPLHSLTGDNWKKTLGYVVSAKKAASDLNGDGTIDAVRPDVNYAPTADPSYVLNPYAGDGDWVKGTAANAVKHTVEVQLSGKDIVYSINGNEILNTQKQMYQVSATNGLATAESNTFYAEKDETTGEYLASETVTTDTVTNTEYSRDTYLEKFETAGVASAGNAVGFTNFQAGMYIYNLKVKLNGTSENTMPNLQDPTFYTVKDASPAIPMFAGKFVDFSDVIVEIGGKLVAADDITWTVADGSAMVINGGIYAPETGMSTLTAEYNGIPKDIYVIANDENAEDSLNFYLVNEDLTNTTAFKADTWYRSNQAGNHWTVTNNGATVKEALTSSQVSTNGLYLNNPWSTKPYMFFYKSDILKDFADYTVNTSVKMYKSEQFSGSEFALIARATLNDTLVVDGAMTAADSTALILGVRAFGGLQLHGYSADSSATVAEPTLGTSLHTLSDSALIKNGTTNLPYVMAGSIVGTAYADNDKTRQLSFKLAGNDIVYSIDGNEIFDSTKSIKTIVYNQNAAAFNADPTSEGTMDDATYENYMSGYNLGKGTIGFSWVRSAYYVESLEVILNDISSANDLPIMSEPAFYTVTSDNPVIPMTAATKLSTGGFLVEVDGAHYVASDFIWTTDAAESNFKVVDGVIYAYERGTYTATLTKGELTSKVHFVVKNPDETEYVVYENDYREENEDVSDWKTVVMVTNSSTNVTTEFTGAYNSEDGKYITGNVADTINTPTYKPHAFVPYDYLALGTTINQANHITTYTTLDNDILADLSDYKVTAGMRMYPNYRGAVGIVGRVSDTVDGLYTVGTSTAVGLASSPGTYANSQRYPTIQAFTIKNQSTYTALSNSEVNYYLSKSINDFRGFEYRVFDIEFSGDTATYTAPNGATEQITGLSATKGTVALFSESRDAASSTYVSVPALADIRIVLNNVDVSTLEFESIDGHTPAATPEIVSYIDKGNYTFTLHENGYINGYTKTDDDTYSRKVVVPSVVDGKECVNWSSLTLSYITTNTAKPERLYNGEVILSEGLEKSWGNALRDNRNLQFVTFPVSYTTISAGDFMGATSLMNISFPEGSKLTAINSLAFYTCSSLHTAKLPEGLKTIGSQAFENCKVLYDVNIPSTVETIGSKAFYNVPSTEVTIPASVESIGTGAFSGNATAVSGVKYINSNGNLATKTVNITTNTTLKKAVILNPDCEIADGAFYDEIAYKYHETDDESTTDVDETTVVVGQSPAPVVVIYGYTGSTAEAYADKFDLEFVPIDNIQEGEIAANSAFNLAASSFNVGGATVAGSDITWDAHRGADYEISNGWLLVYGEEDFTVTGTYETAGDVSIAIKVAAKGTNTGLVVNTIADEKINKYVTIAPVADDATAYTITINETAEVALEYGTLTVTADNCDAVKIVDATDDKGTTFGFSVINPETMVLAAEYTTLEKREASVYPLGAQVRPKTNTYTAGIRFVTRFPEIKMEPAGIYLDEAYNQVGVLIIPYVLWDGTTLPDADALAEADVPMGKADSKGNEYTASNVIVEKLMTATEAYADAAALLTSIPSGMYSVDIMALPYVIGTDGVVTYIEGDPMIKSYSDVLEASYPKYTNADDLFYGGTDHDIDGIASTTSLSYETGEDITFALNLKGAYTLDWSLDKDDPDVNAIADLGEINGSSTVVKTGTFDPAKDGSVFTLTTKMNQAGVVRLTVTFKDVNGTVIDTIYMSAAADYENITQSLEEGFTADELVAQLTNTEGTGYYDTWTAAWDTQVAVVNAAIAADATAKAEAGAQDLSAWLNGTRAVGDEYTIDGVLKLKVAAVGTGENPYTSYHFWIATTADYGITTTGADGFFKDGNFNNRPATGSFSVPTGAAANSLNMKAEFAAYGENTGATSAPTANTVTVRMNSHGMDNDITSAAKTTLLTKYPANGGIKDPIVSMTGDEPTAVYQYGIIRRDYTAIQMAKYLFADILADDLAIATSGGSMGAWQAVTVGALDEAVNDIRVNITWMCQVGAKEYGDITSWHPDYNNTTTTEGARVFSTVTAARVINNRVVAGDKAFTFTIGEAGLGDYGASAPHGLIALYNAFDGADENITKSANFYQFKEHGAKVYGTFTEFVIALANK